MGKPQTGRRSSGHDQALVVDGQHGVQRQTVMQSGDDLHRGDDVLQGDDDGPVSHGPGHGLASWGTHDDVDVEAPGGVQEILGPVGLSGQEEKNAGHSPRMARYRPRWGQSHD